jgi:plasmid replication initiation protein
MFSPAKNESHPLLDHHVNMKNVLAKAAYELTLNEKRMLSIAIAKIDSKEKRISYPLQVSAQEFGQLFDIDSRYAYQELDAAARKFKRRIITYLDVNGGETELSWAPKCTYYKSDRQVKIEFSKEVENCLINLNSQFISYKLRLAVEFKSAYTWRIWELLQTHSKTKGFQKYSLDRLREILQIPDTYQWIHIKDRILLPALHEIADANQFSMYLTGVKTGRPFTAIEIRWRKTDIPEAVGVTFSASQSKKRVKKKKSPNLNVRNKTTLKAADALDQADAEFEEKERKKREEEISWLEKCDQ